MEDLLTQAGRLAETGELEAAIKVLEPMLADEALSPARQGVAYELTGRCELGLLESVQAIEAFAAAEGAYKAAGNEELAEYCRLLQVRKLLDDRHLGEARREVEHASALALEHGWTDVLRLAHELAGNIHLHTKEHRQAVEIIEACLLEPDSRKLGWELLVLKLGMANSYTSLGQHSHSAAILDEVTADPRFRLVPRLELYTLFNQGYNLYLAYDFPAARDCFSQIPLKIRRSGMQRTGLHWLAAMAQYNTGLVDIQLGNYTGASELLMRAWQVGREEGHYQLACACLNSLCVIAVLEDELSQARHYARLCRGMVQQYEDIEAQLTPYFLAIVSLALGDTEQALREWAGKSPLADSPESRIQAGWLRRMLRHIEERGIASPVAVQLADSWLKELERLPRAG